MKAVLYGYYFLMVACFAFSLLYRRFRLVKWLTALLLASIATEALAEMVGTAEHKHYTVYYFFNAVEYALITLALRSQISLPWLRKTMLFSVFVFCAVWLYIGLFVQSPADFPAMGTGIEGVLVIAWSLLTLVYIEPVSDLSIFRLPVFWVALGFLVYFSGTVAVNTVYNYLRHHQAGKAENMFNLINNISNCLLYIFLTIGILCYKGQTKSSAP